MPAVLYIPPADIRPNLIAEGMAIGARPGADDATALVDTRRAGADVCGWVVRRACRGHEALDGWVTFDGECVEVDVVERHDDGDVVKRFPTWGDAADLVRTMDVQGVGSLELVSTIHDDGRRPIVEGGQVLGQAIVAAGRHIPERRVVSSHIVFVRAADARLPLRFALEEVSAGLTFTTLRVDVLQGERRCATATLLLDREAPDVMRYEVDPPEVAGPYDSVRCDMSVAAGKFHGTMR